ncbi:MAG: serine/threonine-protein kinase [Myxococcota bacterium]
MPPDEALDAAVQPSPRSNQTAVVAGRGALTPEHPDSLALMGRVYERLFGSPLEAVRVGRFSLVRRLGAGAMGVVHLAYDDALDRKVAIKLIRNPWSSSGSARLVREARAMARLSHANVVQVYEVGEFSLGTFVAMEFVDGCTLREWLTRADAVDSRRRLQLLLGAGRGLAAAHDAGLVHRDFKPDNVLITRAVEAKVSDFGLSGIVRDSPGGAADPLVSHRAVAAVGTPRYMAPEQLRGESTDERSDQFAFCVMACEVLLGVHPFTGDDAPSLLRAMERGPRLERRAEVALPRRFESVLARGLSWDREARWPSMEALLRRLQPEPRPRRWWKYCVAGIVVVAPVAAWISEDTTCDDGRARLAGVWDAAARAQLDAVFASFDVGYAEQSWRRLQPRIDRYAEGWIAVHRQVCEVGHGSRSPGVEHRRCLQRRLASLDASIGVLTTLDSAGLPYAPDVIDQLPPAARCLADAPAAPTRPHETHAVAAAHRLIDESLALSRLRRGEAALRRADEALAAVQALPATDVVARAHHATGVARLLLTDHGRAVEQFQRAQSIALRGNHHEIALDATVMVSFVLGVAQRRFDEAALAMSFAEGLAARVHDASRRAAIVSTLAAVLIHRGDYGSAQRRLQRARDDLRAEAGPSDPIWGDLQARLGVALLQQHRYRVGLEALHDGLAVYSARLGPDHPRVASVHVRIGNLHRRTGDVSGMTKAFSTARRIYVAAGEQPERVAEVDVALGSPLVAAGRGTDAVDHFRRVLTRWRPVLGAGHPTLLDAASSLADVLVQTGQLEEASDVLRILVDDTERYWGASHPEVLAVRLARVDVLLERGRAGEAEAVARAGLADARLAATPDQRRIGRLLERLAAAVSQQGRPAEAAPLLAEATATLALVAEAGVPEHAPLATDP